MNQFKPYNKEIVLTVLTFFWLLFVATNVNVTLGQTYLSFTLGSLALLIVGVIAFNKRISITFQKKEGGTFGALLAGFGGWIALLIVSVIVLRFIDPAKANIASIIGLMGATTPALAESKIANLITFGLAIGFIETQLWARALEFIADRLGINLDKKQVKAVLVMIILLLAGAFAFFHITAKGLTNISALAIVFIMMVISLIMVVLYRETRQAVYLHVIANTIASYLALFAVGDLVLGSIASIIPIIISVP